MLNGSADHIGNEGVRLENRVRTLRSLRPLGCLQAVDGSNIWLVLLARNRDIDGGGLLDGLSGGGLRSFVSGGDCNFTYLRMPKMMR